MQAQKMDSLLGKIVRINADGSIPKDNPFVGKEGVRPEIWSYRPSQRPGGDAASGDRRAVGGGARHARRRRGERRAQGQGLRLADDCLRHRVSGPPITGGIQQKEGMEQPRYYWDPVIAPSGMMFYTGKLFPAWQNSLFIGGLGSTNLVRLTLKGERVVGEERLLQDLQPSASASATCGRAPTARSIS